LNEKPVAQTLKNKSLAS